MSLSPFSLSTKLSERLTPAKTRELAALILKSEHPRPSSAVVSPLLELLVGGPFDLKENFLIKEPSVLLLLIELLPHFTEELQLELWSTVSVILHRSLWNVHSCRQLQLIDKCLAYLQKTHSSKVAAQVAKVLEVLGTYSVSVKELKSILSYLYASQDASAWAPHSILLIEALNNISVNVQPDVFFNFSGAQGAALTLPPISKWPTQSGFTFSTWLRIEKPYDSQRDYYKPVVYWFRTGKGYGFSAHFIGNTLVLETAGKSHKKPQTHPLPFSFQSYQWYMLSVTYTYRRVRSSELCCYVNGQQVMCTEVSMPSTDDIYDKCFLGSSPSATPDSIFQGQMSAIYLFKEQLSRETVTALYHLGPRYKNQFKFDAETDVPLIDKEKKLLFDGHLSEAVLFSYNAKAVDGQLCLESSPLDNPSPFVHSPHATILEGIDPVVTTSFRSALHSLGGIQVLFPLFSQLDLPQSLNTSSVNYSLCVKLLSLVFELTKTSTSFMLQMVQNRAMSLIRYLLEKVDPKHLSMDVISCIFDFMRYLSVSSNGLDLLRQLIEQLVLNAGLWVAAETAVQVQLYSQLATEYCVKPLGSSGLIPVDMAGVEQLLFSLREHYSIVGEEKGEEGRSRRAKMVEVRSYLLLVVKQFVTKDKGIRESELQSILNYLCIVHEEENLSDVLHLLLALIFEDSSGHTVRLFEELDGLNIATKLLACSSEEITLHALKLIGKVLHHSSPRHQQQLLHTTHILTIVKEKLLSSGEPVSTAMFNTLFEVRSLSTMVLVNCPSRRIIDGHCMALDLSHSIHFPDMLAVMIELISSLHTSLSDWQEGDTLIRLQLFSYISSLCAQNQQNCRALLRLRYWQHWLLVLADQPDAKDSDYSCLQQLLYQLFHTILLYCFQEEQDGWRMWVETTAAIHSYLATKTNSGSPLLPSSNFKSLSRNTSIASTPSSSVEGIREELAIATGDRLPESSLVQHSLRAESVEERAREALPSDTSPSATTHGVQSAGGGGEAGESVKERLAGEGREGEAIKQGGGMTDAKEGKEVGEEGGKEGGVSAREDGDTGSAGPVPVVEGEVPVVASGNGSPGQRSDSPTVSRAKEGPTERESPTLRETENAGTPTSSSPSSQSSSPRRRHKKSKPSPLPPPLVFDVARTPSTESPTSPFFIPSNPFLSIVGRIPRFQWASFHIQLLEDLLKSLLKIVEQWTKGSPVTKRKTASLAEHVGDESNKFLRSNTAHLLALTCDVLVSLNGGLKQLLAKAVNPKLSPRLRLTESIRSSIALSLKSSLASNLTMVRSLLVATLRLSEVMVISGLLKLGTVEGRMKMDPGGMQRQALRLVLADACLSSIEANIRNKELHEHYQRKKHSIQQDHQEAVTLLGTLDITDSSLEKYFQTGMEGKMAHLQDSQCVLSEHSLSLLTMLLEKEGESKQVQEHITRAVVYYLAVVCVAKYRNILDAVGREEGEDLGAESQTSLASHAEGGSQHGDEATPARPKSAETDNSLTPDLDQAFHFPVAEGGEGEGASPMPPSVSFYTQAMDASEQIEVALKLVGPFLCRLLLDNRSVLSKALVGTNSRLLLTDAVWRLVENRSLVEMTMLLCSQEWQASLAKSGGKAFSEILAEGKHVVRFCETYLCSVASKAVADFKTNMETQTTQFTKFEEQLSLFLSLAIRESSEVCQLRRSEGRRHNMYAKDLWRKVSSVVDEYGLFDRSPLRCKFWKLDFKEDAQRQRLKLLANTHGSLHEDARRTVEERGGGEEEWAGEEGMPAAVMAPQPGSPPPQGEEGSLNSEEILEAQLTEQNQAPQLLTLHCTMIVMAYALPGTLVFTPNTFSFNADDSSEEYSKASCLLDYTPINEKWALSDVKAVFSRRYLHQNKALEIFFSNRSSTFMVFSSHREVRDVVRRLPKVGVGIEYDLPQTRSISLATPQQLFRKSSMTARWQRREISNFDYLMYLNTIAGRTYNDLNQYPVFPWILADYNSNKLDLNDPTVYRDLTKPVGALNAERLARLEERLEAWEDDRVPPFLYGTHYSTMAFVLHWMVRVEPFTTVHIRFHDGVFDQGSRMFSSLAQSWGNVCSDSANVKELIPELFYLPEMLVNENKFYLGREGACEEGDVISDVVLPPWAATPYDFIHLHREALESEYVSANLHHWIDLIFGYKQRGEEALKAKNTFYYLTYTGSIDLDAVTDPHQREGLEDQIRHFGQTPTQLLTEAHPPRDPAVKEDPPTPIQGVFPHDPAVVAELQVTPDVPIALVQLSVAQPATVLVVTYNQLYAVNKWSVLPGKPNIPQVYLEPDPHIATGMKVRLGDPLDQSISPSAACFTALPNNDMILVCGFWDNSFKCFNTDTGESVQSVFGHKEIVTCIAFSVERGVWSDPGSGVLATGSHDATVLVWRWSGKEKRVVGPLNGPQESQTGSGSVAPEAILTGHEESVVCVDVSASLGLVVSGAKHGSCLVHSTCGELLHKLTSSRNWTFPHLITLTNRGHIIVHYADQKGCLAAFSCNGKQFAQCALGDPALALTVSGCGRYLVAGGFDCKVRVFLCHSLKRNYVYEAFNSSIRSLHFSHDERYIFAGLASGSVAVLATHYWRQ